jgi:NitT/TauT family transport system substrate-binding protein
MKLKSQIGIALVGVLIAGACAAQKLTPVRFALDWRFEGPAAPYVVGVITRPRAWM